MKIQTLLKNKFVLRNLLKEYGITVLDTKNTDTVVSYLIEDKLNNLDKLKEDFKNSTGHPLIII